MLEGVARQCAAAVPAAPSEPASNESLDLAAVSLSALGASIGWASLVLAGIVLLGGIGWAFAVEARARAIAKKAAKERVDEVCEQMLSEWLQVHAIPILRKLEQMRTPDADGDGNPDYNPDELAQNVDDPEP